MWLSSVVVEVCPFLLHIQHSQSENVLSGGNTVKQAQPPSSWCSPTLPEGQCFCSGKKQNKTVPGRERGMNDTEKDIISRQIANLINSHRQKKIHKDPDEGFLCL